MDELEAGVEFAFAVFPEAAAFLKPGEGAFDNPAFGHDGKGVEVATFGNLHRCANEGVCDGLCKRLTDIASIGQQTANLVEVGAATRKGFQGTFAIGYLGGGHGGRVG